MKFSSLKILSKCLAWLEAVLTNDLYVNLTHALHVAHRPSILVAHDPSRMTQEESRGGGSAAGKIRRGDLGKESRAGEGMEGEERATEGEERAKACC